MKRVLFFLFLLASSALAQTRTAVTRTAAVGRTDAGARSTATRNDLDRLWVLKGNPTKGVTSVSTDPCALVSTAVGGFIGPTAFCLKPDGTSAGTQVDGGALVAFSAYPTDGGGPVTQTASRCPNGPECDAVTFQRFDGGAAGMISYASSAVASPTGDLSCAVLVRRNGSAVSQRLVSKLIGASSVVGLSVASTSIASAGLWSIDGGTLSANSPTLALTGSWISVGFTYDFVEDLSSTLTAYADGTAGTPVANEQGPLREQSSAWQIAALAEGTTIPLDGDIAFAACSEDAWTAAEHLAIATAMRANWTEQVGGGAITFTRASTAYCDSLDGGYGTWLRNNEPCLVGGSYLSEPAATNKALNNKAFDLWTVQVSNLSDAGVLALPVVTANACLAPDGTMTADRVDFPAVEDLGVTPSGGSRVRSATYTATAVAWTSSTYIRAWDPVDGGTLYMADVSQGGAAKACTAGAGWARCEQTKTKNAGSAAVSFGPETLASFGEPTTQPALSVCLWEAQAELGSRASSPIDNAGTALTRAAGVGSTPNNLYGVDPTSWCMGGTFHPDFSAWTSYSTPAIMSVGTWGNANSAGIYFNTTIGKPLFGVYDAAAAVKYVVATTALAFPSAPNWPSVFGCSNAGTLSIYVNGALVATDAAVGAGTGIVTTQPATAYLGTLGTGFQSSGYVSAWRAFVGGFR